MVKKSSPKSDNSFNDKILCKIKSNSSNIKKTNKENIKLQNELLNLKNKIKHLENKVSITEENNILISKWKKNFKLIEKSFLESNDNLKEELPILLMNIMKNINELHTFNLSLINGITKEDKHYKKRKYSSDSDSNYSLEEELSDEEQEEQEEEFDEGDYEIIEQSLDNLTNNIPSDNKNRKNKTDIKEQQIYAKKSKQVKIILKLYKIFNKYNALDIENKETVKEYIYLFIENDKTKHLDKENILYFMSLPIDEKLNLINIEIDINNLTDNSIPARIKIINSSLPIDIKNKCLLKLATFKYIDQNSSEYNKMSNWINGLIDMPWSTYKSLPVNINTNTSTEIYDYLLDGMKSLDDCIYGQRKTKQHMMQLVSKIISNPKSIGNVFSIYGPMGTGKTTIIKEGLSKLLGLPFIFISLGGATDSSFLDGHSYTYEGSIPGRIIEALKSSKCMNPIFYFDELDKVSDTSRGLEIINLLIHLTDPSQNGEFHDKYYGNIPFDLSKALFVFSFNDINKVNPILQDRMNLIKVDGFNEDEKFIITRDFLLPNILREYLINDDDIILDETTIKYIIKKSTTSENGVRGIKKRIETIISNLNVIKISFIDNILTKDCKKKTKLKLTKKKRTSKRLKVSNNNITNLDNLDIDNLNNLDNRDDNGINFTNVMKILPNLKDNKLNNETIKNLKLPINITIDLVDLFLSSDVNLNNPPFGMYS